MDYVTIRLMGGLGNYMFQIACAYSYAKTYNKKLLLKTDDIYTVHEHYSTYLNNVFSNLIFSSAFGLHFIKYNEKSFNYQIIPNINGNVELFGYFQSEKYFINNHEIRNLFSYPNNMKRDLLIKFNNIYNINLLMDDVCSIHVRRGDYVKIQNHHPIQSIEYYISAMNLFDNNQNFLIFSDDIGWCKNNFLNLKKNIIFVENSLDYEDLLYMSMCSHNIIANSTFSWWGAWLNQNENKVVVAPKKWFGSALSSHNICDLYCKDWIII